MNNHHKYPGRIFVPILITLCIGMGNPKSISIMERGTLTFVVSGFKNNEGQALIFLYRKNDKVPDEPFLETKGEINNNSATIKIQDISYDSYAAILAHDKNANDEIDHRFGLPSEPLGYSNNWKLRLFSGPILAI